jgi:CspA family cold shock protein
MKRAPVDPASVHEGVVQTYLADESHGVIATTLTPGGCWVHFSALRDRFELHPGEHVFLTVEAAEQDGFHFRAVAVWVDHASIAAGIDRAWHVRGPSPAFRSTLTITDDG